MKMFKALKISTFSLPLPFHLLDFIQIHSTLHSVVELIREGFALDIINISNHLIVELLRISLSRQKTERKLMSNKGDGAETTGNGSSYSFSSALDLVMENHT